MNNPLGFPYGFFTNDNTPQNAIYYKHFNNTTLPKVPYVDVAEAKSLIVSGLRYKGLTINVNGSEYWWKDGTTDGDLVAKGGTTLTANQLAAITGANTPSGSNVFATMADIVSGTTYQGVWNANTNTPALTSSVGTQGYYYVVNVAGTTDLNGITDWQVGDWAIFNGGTWQKVDNTESPLSIDITNANLITAITNSTIQLGVKYRVLDASPSVVWVWGIDANVVSTQAQLEGDYDGTTWTKGAWGSYDVASGIFIQAIAVDKNGNVFIGTNNTGNTLTTSTDNEFKTYADANTLLDCAKCTFGINSQGNSLNAVSTCNLADGASNNILLNTEKIIIGKDSLGCEIDGGSQVKIGDYCNAIKLLQTTNCAFEDSVINFDNTTYVGIAFTNCTIASGEYTDIDFTAASQLFGRANRWSINKVLGTDLIEVTFDCNLTTAKTGIYDAQSDTFIPYDGNYTPTLTPDGVIITGATLNRAKTQSNGESYLSNSLYIEATVDFSTANQGTIDYTQPFGTLDSSTGSLSFNLSSSAPILPISGYERNGTIYIDCNDTTFSGSIGIFVTITAEITVP